MRFFRRQQQSRRRTMRLVVCYVLALIGTVAITSAGLGSLPVLFGAKVGHSLWWYYLPPALFVAFVDAVVGGVWRAGQPPGVAPDRPHAVTARGGSHMVPERGSKLPDRTAERRPGCTFPRSDTSRCREHLNPSRAVMIGKLWPFALGSVALGLDAYVIAGLLPAIAGSLKASESSVGLGVAAFTGSYAIAGPILAGRAGQRSKQSLTIALAVFMLANVGTAVAPSIVTFLAARAIAGAAAW